MYNDRISGLLSIKIDDSITRNVDIWMLECGKILTYRIFKFNRYIEYARNKNTYEEIEKEFKFSTTDCIRSIIKIIDMVFAQTGSIMTNVVPNEEIYNICLKYLTNLLQFLHSVLIFENPRAKDKKFISFLSVRLDDEIARVFSNKFPEIKKIIAINKRITST